MGDPDGVVSRLLLAKGYKVVAAPNPLRSVSSDAAYVSSILNTIDGPIILVGHSYGGAVITNAANGNQSVKANVLSTQRVNRAALPQLRKQGRGLLVWVSSSSARGGTPPYLAPYFAAKAAMDSVAISYAGELARWGIETSIIVPGAFTKGTSHFAHAGAPADKARAEEYANGPTADFGEVAFKGLAALEPPGANPEAVATAIVKVVDTPFGKRPLRVHIDPSEDGAEIVNSVADRVRAELLRRIGLGDILKPSAPGGRRQAPSARADRSRRARPE